LANFVNGELWGRVTDVPWAMVFPDPGAGGLPRHPSQLYEAALEGIALFFVLRWLTHSRLFLNRPGIVTGTFLIGYAVARTFCEFYREGEKMAIDPSGTFTLGMLYSLPMVVGGAYLWWRARENVIRAA
jgi:phosphatidylglycerol---prolipoprotein diacylglyceryl transferase